MPHRGCPIRSRAQFARSGWASRGARSCCIQAESPSVIASSRITRSKPCTTTFRFPLSILTPSTPAPHRPQAHSASPPSRATTASTTGLGGGTFLVEAGARTGIHHHGEQETIVYVLEGELLIRWGAHGESEALRLSTGDFLHVPAFTPHMEINLSEENPFRWIVVRSTPDPIVVNLPVDYWG